MSSDAGAHRRARPARRYECRRRRLPARRDAARAGARRRPASQHEPAPSAAPDSDEQPSRERRLSAAGRRLLVLEPGAHARFGDRLGDRGRRQLRGVVLDAQPLADDVGVERLEAGSGFSRRSRIATSSWQSIPSILKTDSACSSQTVHVVRHARLLHVSCSRLSSASSSRMCWSSSGVVDVPAGAARADEPHAAQQPQLVRDGGLADADERGDVADAQLGAAAGRRGCGRAWGRRARGTFRPARDRRRAIAAAGARALHASRCGASQGSSVPRLGNLGPGMMTLIYAAGAQECYSADVAGSRVDIRLTCSSHGRGSAGTTLISEPSDAIVMLQRRHTGAP